MDAEPDSVLHSETAVPVTWVGYALGGAAASWAFAAGAQPKGCPGAAASLEGAYADP